MNMMTGGEDAFEADEKPPIGDVTGSVQAIHREIDRQTLAFQRSTRLRCPEKCGRCCLSPSVETTATDLMPLALQVVRSGQAGVLLERLDERPDDTRCVLYASEPADPGRGRCSMYEWRPSICRLFGFAGRRDADGAPQFIACRVHTETMPDVVDVATAALQRRAIALPIFSDLAGQVASLAPGSAGRPQPINAALREAIHRAGLAVRLGEGDEDDRPERSTPGRPRRAA